MWWTGPWLVVWLVVAVLGGCGRVGFEASRASDAAADGAGSDAVLGACPEFAIFCDDFESGELAKWTEVNIFGPGTLALTGSRVRSGSFAIDAAVAVQRSGSAGASLKQRLPPQTSGVLAVRQWVNLAVPLRFFSLVLVIENEDGSRYVSAGGNNEANWVSTEDASGGNPVDHPSLVMTPVLDTWTCVELVFTFAQAGPGRIELFIDDAVVLDLTATDLTPRYTDIHVGIGRGDETGFQVFVDDVVIANQRIGC